MAHDPEQRAFLQAIINDPADDAVRLAFADWLDEHGQPARAHFIRDMIAAFRSAGREHPVPLNLTSDSRNIAGEPFGGPPYRGWVAEAGCEVPGVEGVSFERGFVEAVRARADTFVTHGATWVAQAPVRSVLLSATARRVAVLARCEHLNRIESLTIDEPRFGDGSLSALLNSPHLEQLRVLDIPGAVDVRRPGLSAIGADGVRSLTRSPVAERLTELTIRTSGRIGAGPVRELLTVMNKAQLRSLDLAGGELGNDGAFVLAESEALDEGRSLSVRSNQIGDAGLMALVGSSTLRRVERLNLSNNRISGAGLGALCRVQLPPGLAWLCLPDNPLGPIDTRGLLRLLQSRPSLRVSLVGCGIPGPQRRTLLEAAPGQIWTDELPRSSV